MHQQMSRISAYLVFAIVLIVTLGIILYVVHSGTNSIVSDLTLNRVQSANRELVSYVQNLQDSILRRTEIIARNENIVDLVKSGDHDLLIRYLRDFSSGMDSVNICDSKGIAFIRTHSDAIGDDVSRYKAISAALLTGIGSSAIDEIETLDNNLAIYASAPIYDGQNLLGAVNCSYNLEHDNFLDSLRDETGCFSSIFYGARRINTTILNLDNTRAIGTLAGDEVVNKVIGRGDVYTGRQLMIGKMYEVCFSPLFSGGQVIGMLATSFDIDSTIKKQQIMDTFIVLAFLINVAAAGFFIIISSRASQKHNRELEELLNEKAESHNIMERILYAMDVYIYATELETDKILFVNKNMAQGFGLTRDVRGEPCWKIFQLGLDQRCDFCPKYKLEIDPDKPVVWEEHNLITKRYYKNIDRIIDWPDGSKVHLQQSNDITELKDALALEKQLQQQTLMANISRSFLSNIDVDTVIADNLRMIGQFMGIPQALFFRMENDGSTLVCQNEWIDPDLGLESCMDTRILLKEPVLSIMKALKPGMGNDSCLHSNDPVIKEAVLPYRLNFRNYIITTVFVRDKLVAVIDFSREDDGRLWSESDINLATLFASTLSGVFERDAMVRQYSVVENTPNIVLYVDTNGELAYFNPAVITITGYTADELNADGFNLIFDEPTVRSIKDTFLPQTLLKGADRRQVVLKCKDGRRRILELSSFIVRKNTVAAIATDITEEQALKTELVKAKELAERASRVKSEFISRMSHEMRTPMNAIMGMTKLARNADDPVKKDDFLVKANNASHKLLQLIDDLLNITEINDGSFSLVYSHFSFTAMLRNVLDVAKLYINAKHQELSVDIDPSMPGIFRGDEQRLAQTINHLLANASKFTPQGGSIQFKAIVLGRENSICTLRIEVADSGIGIPGEQQEIIFNFFEQVDGGIDRKFDGAGLGLALSRRIIELMGGQIRVESDHGKGAKFIFTVKMETGDLPDSNVPELSLEGRTALLVEDNEINREVVIAILDGTGINIECAENGFQALELFSANPDRYDIIFMDINMPQMDGLEATRRIRGFHAPEGARVPIIAMTANVRPEDVLKYFTAGMNDHIGKPIDFDELLHKLKKYLN